MADRNYGVKFAPGTQVTERDAIGPISPGNFGTAFMAGVCERGAPGRLILVDGPNSIRRRVGTRRSGSLLVDGVEGYFEQSRNSGRVLVARVTDGNESAASVVLYGRGTGAALWVPNGQKGNQSQVQIPVLRLEAKDGGRWAGRKKFLTSDITISGAVTETTIATGVAMEVDEYKGALVYLYGAHLTSGVKPLEVLSNTALGVLTLRPDATAATDLAEGTSQTSAAVVVRLDPEILDGGFEKGLRIYVRNGGLSPSSQFGLDVFLDGVRVHGWSDLSMDPTSPLYAPTVINEDPGNLEITATSLVPEGTTWIPDLRPAVYYGMVTGATASQLTVNPVTVVQNDNPAEIKIVGWDLHADAKSGAVPLVPMRLTFTYVLASTKYLITVEATTDEGVVIANMSTAISEFTVGAAPQRQKTYSTNNPLLPSITIDHPSEPANGDQFVIEVRPLPQSMVRSRVYPDAVGAIYKGLVVKSVGYKTLTVESGDPSAVATVAGVATVSGDETGTFVIADGVSDEMKIAIDGREAVTVELTDGGTQSLAAIVADINDAFDAIYGVGVLRPASVSAAGLKLTSPGGFDGAGPGSSVEIISSTAVHAAALSLLGLTAGITYGSLGSEVRVDSPARLTGGYDGAAPDLQDYLDVFSLDDSPLRFAGTDYAAVACCTPGITQALSASDAALVQRAGHDYCETKPYEFFDEVPVDRVTEQSILGYLNDSIGQSDMAACWVPGLLKVPDPDRAGIPKLVSTLPLVIGRWAQFAQANQGYHKPAAGSDAKLTGVLGYPDGYENGLDAEILTPAGVNIIKPSRGGFVIGGARTRSTNKRWSQLSVRWQFSHYVWVFLESFDWVNFKLNNKITWAQIRSVAYQYFSEELAKQALDGDSVADAATIKVDSDNNTAATKEAGDAHADFSLRLSRYIERFKISVSQRGITEDQ